MRLILSRLYIPLICLFVVSFAGCRTVTQSVFRDDFETSDLRQWETKGPPPTVRDGALVLKTSGSQGNAISVSSADYFLYGSAETRVRFSRLGKGAYYYLGFMSRYPWAANTAWLMNCSASEFTTWSIKDEIESRSPHTTTGKLEPNRWYTFRIDWTPEYVELFVDGVSRGRMDDTAAISSVPVPVVFDCWSAGEEITMEVDSVRVTGKRVKPDVPPILKEIPLPVKPKKVKTDLPRKSPVITLSGSTATLENSYLKCDLSLDQGPVITGLMNKFISADIIDGGSRLFLVHHDLREIANTGYRLLEARVEKSDKGQVLRSRWQSSTAPLEIDLDILLEDSPEMTWQMAIKNTGGKKETFGITCPLLEHIRLGKQIGDDMYFYPQSSGLCGSTSCDLRAAYGGQAWMQIMDVFNPSVGGGLYTFSKDSTGYPKVLILRKKARENERPFEYEYVLYPGQNPGMIFDRRPGTAMAVRHIEYQLKAGESVRLPDTAVGVHAGDWHYPLGRYSQWVRSWYRKALPTPSWYMDTFAYLAAHPNSLLSASLMSKKSETPGYWDFGKKEFAYSRQMGVKEENSLMEWAWWWEHKRPRPGMTMEEGINEGLPEITQFQHGDYDYSTALGGLPALKKEISSIHEKKGRFLLYTYYTACWQGTRIGLEHGKEWARMRAPGVYTHDHLRPDEGWNICPYVPGWRDYYSDLMAKKIKETGADGYRLDVAALMYPCYNANHSHYDGATRSIISPKEMAGLLSACQTKVRAANPEAITTVELAGSDYLTQFTDGYLSQTISWYGSPAFEGFRELNRYQLVFTRFYLPESKTCILGAPDSDMAINMALFNATALGYPPARGATKYDALREHGDAFNSGMQPEPMVDTLVDGVYANYFPSPGKMVWTIYNRNGKKVDQPLIEVPFRKDVRYVEVFHDTPVKAVRKDNMVQLSLPVEHNEVVCIAELPQIADAAVKANAVEVRLAKGIPSGYTLQVAFGEDLPGKRQELCFTDGRACFEMPNPAQKTIIRVMKGYYLADEIILRAPAGDKGAD